MTASLRLVLLSLSAVLLLGAVPVVIKFIQAGPWTVAITRLILGVSCVGAYGWWRRDFRKPGAVDLAALALMGLCFGIHWITYFYSIKLSSATLAMLTLSIYGPCVILWSRLILKQRIHATDMVALALALAGTLLCAPEFKVGSGMMVGFLLGIASGMIYALLPILQQKTAAFPVTMKAFGQFTFALIAFLPFWGYTDWHLGTQDWLGLLFLGIGGTVIAHSLWVNITTQLPPAVISVLSYAQIPVAMFLSVIFLDEALRWQLVLGAMLIIGGNLFGVYCRLRRSSQRS